MGSEGFIQDPATKETKRFHRDEQSWTRDPKVFVDTGLPMPGEPPLLKTRVHLRRDTAEQLWREFIALAGNKWTLAGELLLSPRDKGCRGAFGPCLYVKGVQKFLPVFKSDGSRGSTACDWSATGHPGASRDPLVRLDQDAE